MTDGRRRRRRRERPGKKGQARERAGMPIIIITIKILSFSDLTVLPANGRDGRRKGCLSYGKMPLGLILRTFLLLPSPYLPFLSSRNGQDERDVTNERTNGALPIPTDRPGNTISFLPFPEPEPEPNQRQSQPISNRPHLGTISGADGHDPSEGEGVEKRGKRSSYIF